MHNFCCVYYNVFLYVMHSKRNISCQCKIYYLTAPCQILIGVRFSVEKEHMHTRTRARTDHSKAAAAAAGKPVVCERENVHKQECGFASACTCYRLSLRRVCKSFLPGVL